MRVRFAVRAASHWEANLKCLFRRSWRTTWTRCKSRKAFPCEAGVNQPETFGLANLRIGTSALRCGRPAGQVSWLCVSAAGFCLRSRRVFLKRDSKRQFTMFAL